MIFNIIGIIIGAMIFAAGIYYFFREKEDNESRRIYSITTVIGALILVFMIIRLLL